MPEERRVIYRIDEFEAHSTQIIDEVAETGLPVIIIRDGKPVFAVIPHTDKIELFDEAYELSKAEAQALRAALDENLHAPIPQAPTKTSPQRKPRRKRRTV